MINRQLETNVNNERILEKLAENLNIDFISDGSNLKKIADTYSEENLNYATNVDDAIANGFLSTMSSEFLELFGNQYNVYRKNYNNISIYAYQEAINITPSKIDAMVTELNEDYVVFKKGDLIYSDDNVIIESLGNVNISSLNDTKNISCLISLAVDLDSYIIQEGSEFPVYTTNTILKNLIPTFVLTFTRPVGLAILQEYEEDYKLRIYESTYIANNGANSLVSAITKEVPFLHFIETDDYTNGRGIKTLYPYTKELIDTGFDDLLDNLILPLIETNLKGKVLNGQLVEVLKPEPLLLNVTITFKEGLNVNNTFLENTVRNFNDFFSTYKTINRLVLEDFIKSDIGLSDEDVLSTEFVFTSPYVSEETFTIKVTDTDLIIPKGRFLHLNSITRNN